MPDYLGRNIDYSLISTKYLTVLLWRQSKVGRKAFRNSLPKLMAQFSQNERVWGTQGPIQQIVVNINCKGMTITKNK